MKICLSFDPRAVIRTFDYFSCWITDGASGAGIKNHRRTTVWSGWSAVKGCTEQKCFFVQSLLFQLVSNLSFTTHSLDSFLIFW